MDENNIIGSPNADNIFSDPTGGFTDLLNGIIGTVYTEGLSGTASLLTYLYGFMNFYAFYIASVLLAFSMIKSLVKTLQNGKVTDSKITWVGLAKSIAIVGLLYPVNYTGTVNSAGLAPIQFIVMELTHIGNNGANEIATFVAQNGSKKRVSFPSSAVGFETIEDLTKMAFCTRALNVGIEEFTDFRGAMYAWDAKSQSHVSLQNAINSATSGTGENRTNSIEIGNAGNCGTISMPSDFEGSDYLAKPVLTVNAHALNKIMNQVVLKIDQDDEWYSFSDYKVAVDNANPYLLSRVNTASQNLANIAKDYELELINAIRVAFNANYEKNNPGMKVIEGSGKDLWVTIDEKPIKELGWIYLGAYRSMVSNNVTDTLNMLRVATTTTKMDYSFDSGCNATSDEGWSVLRSIKGFFGEQDCGYRGYDNVYNKYGFAVRGASDILKTSKNARLAMEASCNESGCNPNNTVNSFGKMLASPLLEYRDNHSASSMLGGYFLNKVGYNVDEYNDVRSGLGGSSAPDSLLTLQEMGLKIIYYGNVARYFTFGLDGLAEGLKSTGVFTLWIGAAVAGAILSVSDYLKHMVSVVQISGITMAYYLPKLSGIVYSFGVMNYVIIVMEAMAMSGVAIALQAAPEGEGIAGANLQRLIGMLLTLVLRPPLLVIFYVMAQYVQDYGFLYMNHIYWISVGDSEMWSWDILGTTSIIAILTMFLIAFFHMTAKIPTTSTDSVMNWAFGGLTSMFGSNGDQMAVDKLANSQPSNPNIGASTGGVGKALGNKLGRRYTSGGKDSSGS